MRKTELIELSTEECWWHLAEKSVGRLAVSVANRPDIFPVNYRIDGETIVVKTAPGFKLAAATLGSGVAFEVDQLDEAARTGWSVVVHGQATEIERLEELLDADDLEVGPWAAGTKNHYIRINPTAVTGRRVPAAGSD
ncbi:MAG: pyridoxamine 5'-phosphate oxidase family protein [Acidimicrobiales bacterium]